MMPRRKDEEYDKPFMDEVILELIEDDTFKIGQCYEEEAATTLCCKKCGSHSFNVGQGSYFTAIKCINCDYQVCIHDG